MRGAEHRPGQVAFQKFDAGLPGGDTTANAPVPLHQSPEQQYYQELLGGFFAKLTRWQMLLADEQFLRKGEDIDAEIRSFDVITTSEGSLIVPKQQTESVLPMERSDKILGIGTTAWERPEYDHYHKHFTISPGQAGTQKLVDINGEPFKYVEIEVVKANFTSPTQWLSIFAEIASVGDDPHLGNYDRLKVEYEERRNRLTRGLFSKGSKLMPDAYASHLLTTIDELIPQPLGGSPQSSEKPPKPLAPRRR